MSDGITEARRSMTNRVQTYYQKRPKVKAIQYKIENLEEVKSFLDGFYIEVVDDNKLLIHNNTGPDVLVPVGNYITNDMFNNVHAYTPVEFFNIYE